MLYLFYGEDRFSLREQVEKIKVANLPPEAIEFGFTRIESGRGEFNVDEVINTAEAYPFLSEKKVVQTVDMAAKLGRGADTEGDTPAPKPAPKARSKASAAGTATVSPRERFIAFLGRVPETTVLIMVESKINKNDAIYKAVQKYGQIQEFVAPKELHLEKWVTEHARRLQIKVEPQAVSLLARYCGSDLYRIDNELQKLAAYAGEGQTVKAAMVEEISPEMRDTPIYKLTEALSNKNLRDALVQLNRMRNETTLPRNGFARYVFNGICRNVYDLLRVREMAAQRLSSAEIASKLGMHPFVADKNMKLSRNFQAARLDWLYHRLTELDYADKTGRADLTSELDLLLVEICAA